MFFLQYLYEVTLFIIALRHVLCLKIETHSRRCSAVFLHPLFQPCLFGNMRAMFTLEILPANTLETKPFNKTDQLGQKITLRKRYIDATYNRTLTVILT